MNKIEKLIEELCPGGVTVKQLGQVAVVSKGMQVNRETLDDINPFPVYNGGIYPSGRHTESNFPAETITVSQGGASAGYVNFVMEPLWVGAHCYAVVPGPAVINRFLFFVIKTQQGNLQGKKYGAGIPALDKKTLSNIQVPVPPIVVQQEIVSILDKFTELEAELEAELEGRRIQYENLRENCFRFELKDYRNPFRDLLERWCPSGVEVRDLGNCVTENLGGGTPSRARGDFWNGEIQWASVGDITSSSISISRTRQTISDLGLRSSSTKLIPAGHVIVAVKINPGAMRVVTADMAINQDIRGLLLKPEINPYYLTYFFKTFTIASNGTIVQGITNATLLKVKVPVPPMAIQNEIVDLLDSLSEIVTSPDRGIPAELTARSQQYEYYRKKLLTFKELKAS
jgi:type I restriction enzyme S subunit